MNLLDQYADELQMAPHTTPESYEAEYRALGERRSLASWKALLSFIENGDAGEVGTIRHEAESVLQFTKNDDGSVTIRVQ